LDLRLAAAEARAEEAQRTAARLAGLAGERTDEQAAAEVHAAAASLPAVLARREELRTALAGVQDRMATLAAGRVPVPAEVAAFRERLGAGGRRGPGGVGGPARVGAAGGGGGPGG